MNHIRILGASGTRTANEGTTCLQITPHLLIDAGAIIAPLGESAKAIRHIFVTHAHFDHIADLTALLDQHFTDRTHTLHLYGLPETIEALQTHLFNGIFFPDFSAIPLKNGTGAVLSFHPVSLGKRYDVDGVTLIPFATRHTVPSCGYIIEREDRAIAFTSDTAADDTLLELIRQTPAIRTLITELSYASSHQTLADDSGHMTPHDLLRMSQAIAPHPIRILVLHLKPSDREEILEEIARTPELSLTLLSDGDRVPFDPALPLKRADVYPHKTSYDLLMEAGIALGSETDLDKLYSRLLQTARTLTHSDAGTLYLLDTQQNTLQFRAVQNDTLDLHFSGTELPSSWTPLPLYLGDGTPNNRLVATRCALEGFPIHVEDAYAQSSAFDFSGTHAFDDLTGYQSHSMLLVPLKNHEKKVIGVLQLINKSMQGEGSIPYTDDDARLLKALGSQAAVAINNQTLIQDLEIFFESLLRSITLALSKKSPHTGAHIQRMVDLSCMLADAVSADTDQYASIRFSTQDRKTIEIAALMHDLGKIATPDHIVDKASKLEGIYDRIESIRWRFHLLRQAHTIDSVDPLPTLEELDKALSFLEEANTGSHFFSRDDQSYLAQIATWMLPGDRQVPLLSDEELAALSVPRGTLSSQERDTINHHASDTIEILEAIQFPQKYSRVPEIAGAHHEKMNGTGYPYGLAGEEISLEARILAVADVFEALTASDRPYKRPNTLSEAMHILKKMADANEIDRQLFLLFYRSGVYRRYGEKYLRKEQCDSVEIRM